MYNIKLVDLVGALHYFPLTKDSTMGKSSYHEECLKGRIATDQEFRNLVAQGKIKVGDAFTNFDLSGYSNHIQNGVISEIITERRPDDKWQIGVIIKQSDGTSMRVGYTMCVYREEGFGYMPFLIWNPRQTPDIVQI